jgi:arylsulfatase A-like enzyme
MNLTRLSLLVAGLLALSVSLRAATTAKPNIIFILADDYGVGEVSAYGADNYKTPNIDALARGGTRYTHAYTPSLCGPSRATILTGRYLFRTGATNQDATGRFTPAAETMMPTILKSAG